MAASRKKVVSQEDLRRLMKEKQAKVKISTKKIDHPLAKYNTLNQLVCVLCNQVIKSDMLWMAHIQGKQHKEMLPLMKNKTSESLGVKRKTDTLSDGASFAKKSKDLNSSNGSKNVSGLPADFFDNSISRPSNVKGSTSTKSVIPPSATSSSKITSSSKPAGKSVIAQYSSSSEDSDEESSAPAPDVSNRKTSQTNSALPPDFFDTGGPSKPAEEKSEDKQKPATMAEALPEGFFDDPVQDAKVRQVEYVDKMEEEWELFQKTMKEETHVSEAIMEEEDEQVNVDRNIDEIDEQIQCWKDVNDLQNKKDEIMQKAPKSKDNDSDNESLDEEDLEQFMDWRAKKSWR